MKTIISQCLTKAKNNKSIQHSRKKNNVNNFTIEMARTITESIENPDRCLCTKLF